MLKPALKKAAKKMLPDSIQRKLKAMISTSPPTPAPTLATVAASPPTPASTIPTIASHPTVRVITNPADLDAEVADADAKAALSDAEFRNAIESFCYASQQPLPSDPYSKEYRDFQMNLYLEISGRKQYSIDNESSPFDLESAKARPFPYMTHNPAVVGDQLIAQGFLIRTLNLPPGARILEFGPGWGNTTLHFAQIGYQVTAVDTEQKFLDLIQHRANALGVSVELICQDMLSFRSEEKFDAAVFFESFHHCADHLQLLKNLNSFVKEDGIIAFASEPITDFPYPWGVRLDGISVYSIRKFGWLELGFSTAYFMETLAKFGWNATRTQSDINPIADVIIARRATNDGKL
jgi:SAM-dependent methyltransferase